MARLIEGPTRIRAAGSPPKEIEEYVGHANSGTGAVSVARMRSPCGWKEPGQVGRFDEYTVVLSGTLHLDLRGGEMDVSAGQAVVVPAGEWVRYSTPAPGGADYVAVCLPAFSPDLVARDE